MRGHYIEMRYRALYRDAGLYMEMRGIIYKKVSSALDKRCGALYIYGLCRKKEGKKGGKINLLTHLPTVWKVCFGRRFVRGGREMRALWALEAQ
jgi:hypothetical protein